VDDQEDYGFYEDYSEDNDEERRAPHFSSEWKKVYRFFFGDDDDDDVDEGEASSEVDTVSVLTAETLCTVNGTTVTTFRDGMLILQNRWDDSRESEH